MSIKSNLVRAAFAALCLSTFVGAAPQPAQADPYQWCAEYSGRGGGTQLLLPHVQPVPRGDPRLGGTCTLNPFYTGRPIITPQETFVVRAPRRVIYYISEGS